MDERDEELMPEGDETPKNGQAATVQGGILKKIWKEFGYLIIPVVVVFILLKVIFSLAYVPSGSMETTLPTNSLFLGYRLPYLLQMTEPARGDIIMFQSDELDKILVKRTIGVEGDVITFNNGYVFVNGEQLDEDYLPGTEGSTQPGAPDDTFVVPEDCVFVLGDNRTDSYDSRFWANPYVTIDSVKSRAIVDIAFMPSCSRRGVFMVW